VVFLLFGRLRMVSNVEPHFPYDLSDGKIEAQVNLHLAYKWFAGLPFDVAPFGSEPQGRRQGRELAEGQPEEAMEHAPPCWLRERRPTSPLK